MDSSVCDQCEKPLPPRPVVEGDSAFCSDACADKPDTPVWAGTDLD